MNLPFFLAKKYFFSRRKRGFIDFISLLSMLGVCVGTAALVIILSVFNGLEDLNRQIFKTIDPDLKIVSRDGRPFQISTQVEKKIAETKGVKYMTPVIEENALARYGGAQMVVLLRGVDSTFQQFSSLAKATVQGVLLTEEKGYSFAFIGGGVYRGLNVNIADFGLPLEIWYPKNQKLNALNPESNIQEISVTVSGVFTIEQRYDNLVYLPIHVVDNLTEKKGNYSYFEVYAAEGISHENLKKSIQNITGNQLIIQTRDEQNEALFRAIRIEKLFIFLSLLFIIGIASFNIFFSLTMLVIDNQEDIRTLRAIGAPSRLIFQTFLKEGVLITWIGGVLGILLGLTVCWIQLQYGLVGMGMASAIVDQYPVIIVWTDILLIALGISLIGILVSIFPANKAVSMLHKKNVPIV